MISSVTPRERSARSPQVRDTYSSGRCHFAVRCCTPTRRACCSCSSAQGACSPGAAPRASSMAPACERPSLPSTRAAAPARRARTLPAGCDPKGRALAAAGGAGMLPSPAACCCHLEVVQFGRTFQPNRSDHLWAAAVLAGEHVVCSAGAPTTTVRAVTRLLAFRLRLGCCIPFNCLESPVCLHHQPPGRQRSARRGTDAAWSGALDPLQCPAPGPPPATAAPA
jgi:hypothetical protein